MNKFNSIKRFAQKENITMVEKETNTGTRLILKKEGLTVQVRDSTYFKGFSVSVSHDTLDLRSGKHYNTQKEVIELITDLLLEI